MHPSPVLVGHLPHRPSCTGLPGSHFSLRPLPPVTLCKACPNHPLPQSGWCPPRIPAQEPPPHLPMIVLSLRVITACCRIVSSRQTGLLQGAGILSRGWLSSSASLRVQPEGRTPREVPHRRTHRPASRRPLSQASFPYPRPDSFCGTCLHSWLSSHQAPNPKLQPHKFHMSKHIRSPRPGGEVTRGGEVPTRPPIAIAGNLWVKKSSQKHKVTSQKCPPADGRAWRHQTCQLKCPMNI